MGRKSKITRSKGCVWGISRDLSEKSKSTGTWVKWWRWWWAPLRHLKQEVWILTPSIWCISNPTYGSFVNLRRHSSSWLLITQWIGLFNTKTALKSSVARTFQYSTSLYVFNSMTAGVHEPKSMRTGRQLSKINTFPGFRSLEREQNRHWN